jgi:hypothetical protein
MIYNHGVTNAILRLKTIRLCTTRYLCGSPLLRSPEGVNLRINKKGLPSQLGPLQDLAEIGNPAKIRILLTLLNLSRVIEGGHKEPNLEPIVKPTTFQMSDAMRQDISKALDQLGFKTSLRNIPAWKDFHPSTKMGPNGQALISSVNDAHVLKNSYSDLMKDLLTLSGSEDLLNAIN